MHHPHPRREGGFTIVELSVVLLVVGVLLAFAIPTYAGMANGANDASTQSLLKGSMATERFYHSENGTFTSDTDELSSTDSALRWNVDDDPPGTVRVKMDDNRATSEVCLYSLSESGTWFAVYHHETTGTLYGEADGLRDCSADTVASHWTEGW